MVEEMTFVHGTMQEYVSKISFSLNFEDKSPSVKIFKDDIVKYDGEFAVYVDKKGKEYKGKTFSLKAAINNGWLEKKGSNGAPITEPTILDIIQQQSAKVKETTYDPFLGGNFDEYVGKMNDAQPAKSERKTSGVIKEEDRTVRKFGGEKLEIAPDQSEVRSITVNSSTAVAPKTRVHSSDVRQSEDYGASHTMNISTKKKKASVARKSFTVDAFTSAIPEDVTLAEVKRAQKVVTSEESQDAVVVKKMVRGSMKVESPEGISVTTKSTDSANVDINTKASVSSGGSSIADLSGDQGAVVVKKIGQAGSVSEPVEDQGVVVVKKIGEKLPEIKPEEVKPEEVKLQEPVSSDSYLKMLPDDWADMHWVKKEKFIKSLTDKGFLQFIMRVDTIKAVQSACKARIDELNKQTAN